MANIFISYSRKDEKFARQLAKSLSDLGADVWIDVDDIPAGMKWSTAIQQGLDVCDAGIVIITPTSMASHNVEDEWQYILDNKKPLIPILLQQTKIHFQLSRVQYVRFDNRPFDEALADLVHQFALKSIMLDKPSPKQPVTLTPMERLRQQITLPWLIGGGLVFIALVVLLLVLASQPETLTGLQQTQTRVASGPTNTRTPRPFVGDADLTSTEQMALFLAETELALTEFAPTFDAINATAAVLTQTAESFTPTPTPNRLNTLRATRTSGAATATAIALGTILPTENATQTPTPIPSLTPVSIACPGAPVSRLNNGMAAVIAPSPDQSMLDMNIRNEPAGLVIAQIREGSAIFIKGTPVCRNEFLWWFIETADGFVRGWAAEGALPDDYYLIPMLPG